MSAIKTFLAGRAPLRGFARHAVPALVCFAILEMLALSINDYWGALWFLPLQAATLIVAMWFWLSVARRFHDAGVKAWLPLSVIGLSIASKLYLTVTWVFATNREFEMGAAIWTAMFEPMVHAGFLAISLIFLFRPSQPGPNEYGPNPHEVSP